MKKKRRRQHKKTKKQRKLNNPKKILRRGSRQVKLKLLSANPTCDICGCKGCLQLHHVYFIRHGFKTEQERCILLCETCHKKFHKKFDKYFDRLFVENPDTDFLKIYNEIKNQL